MELFPNFYKDDFRVNFFMYHVGVDSHNCTPVKLDDIIEEIKRTISNINQIILNNPVLYNIMDRISHKKGNNDIENT